MSQHLQRNGGMRVQTIPPNAAPAHHHAHHHHHPGGLPAQALAFNPQAALLSGIQAQTQSGGHAGAPQPGYFIPTIPSQHLQQSARYYQGPNQMAPQGQGPQGQNQMRPRWTQGPPQGPGGVRAQNQFQMQRNASRGQQGAQQPRGPINGGQQRAPLSANQMQPRQGGPQQRQSGPRAQSQVSGQQFKYQNNTRNVPQNVGGVTPVSQVAPPPQQGIAVPGQEPLTASMLADANPQEQKQMLGEL